MQAKISLSSPVIERNYMSRSKKLLTQIWFHRWLYVALIPVLAYYVIFKYIPMKGIIMAFQDYNVFKGIGGSEFVGLDVFKRILSNKNFWMSVKNTLVLNLGTLIICFPFTIAVALMLNEVRLMKFKKVAQSILYLPHFVSWVVVAGIATNMFAQKDGTINMFLAHFGIPNIPFLSSNSWWIFTYIVSNVWKELGWGTIIYLAALAGVDETLYEAAYLDGATKFQRLIYITLPSIKSVIVTMLILQISKMMTIGLDAPLLLGNDKVLSVSEVISTYVYRIGIENAKYSDSTAVGLFQSVVNIIILIAADKFAKSIGEEGII